MENIVNLPGIGKFTSSSGFNLLNQTSDGLYRLNKNGVSVIVATGDSKVEFVVIENKTIAHVKSSMGYPAYYPVYPVKLQRPVKAILMDLDGTTVKSEEFWIWIIQLTMASLLGNSGFKLENTDIPYVSGHSISEHLNYCIEKYCPEKSVEAARDYYFKHTKIEMEKILKGIGNENAFTPAPGLKEFLLEVKSLDIKIGLVTSGSYEKAWPEILSAFRTLKMGDPKEFYDAIITAGYPLRKGEIGTLGELCPKPHPWLYAETCRVGLGIANEEKSHVIGIEDSGAGICSIRLAGYNAIGISGGNITNSGTKELCNYYCSSFGEIMKIIKG